MRKICKELGRKRKMAPCQLSSAALSCTFRLRTRGVDRLASRNKSPNPFVLEAIRVPTLSAHLIPTVL